MDLETLIVAVFCLVDDFVGDPELGRLSQEGGAVHLPQAGKQVAEVAPEVGVQAPVGVEAEELADDLDRQHLVIAYFAERTLARVLERIPREVFQDYETEILVVDDAKPNIKILADLLSDQAQVFFATNGQAALQMDVIEVMFVLLV